MEGHCIMKTVWFYQKRLKKQAFVTFKLCFGKWSYVSWCALSVARNRLCPVSRFQLVQLRRTISVTRAGVRTVDLFFGRILKSMPLKSAGLPHARSNDALLAWASHKSCADDWTWCHVWDLEEAMKYSGSPTDMHLASGCQFPGASGLGNQTSYEGGVEVGVGWQQCKI